MPEGALSLTVRSIQLFPTEKSEVKIQSQFASLLYTSLPYPGNAPQPQDFPNSCSGPCLTNSSNFLCLSGAILRERLMIETSLEWSFPPLGPWSNFSQPQND